MMSEKQKPFLNLPFYKQLYTITEGWHYSEEEKSIHGFSGHSAVDFRLPRSTPVLAAADGLAVASYFAYPLKKMDQPVLYQEKQIWFGLGYFVQIYHPQNNLYTAYGHLEKVAPAVLFHKPIKKGEKYWPVGHKIKPENLTHYRFAKFVTAGEVIGFVGDSGLNWGYEDFPKRPDPQKFPSWDEVHLHFEVFERYGSRKKKRYFDPYGIKSVAEDYPNSYKSDLPLGQKSPLLWNMDINNLPKFT